MTAHAIGSLDDRFQGAVSDFNRCILVLNDMVVRLIKPKTLFFTIGRHEEIQMTVMCHKPAQIDKMARPSTNTI